MNAEIVPRQKSRRGRQPMAWIALFVALLAGWQASLLANWETEESVGDSLVVAFEHNRPELITKEINNLELQCLIVGVTNPIALPLGLLEARLTVKAQIYSADPATNDAVLGQKSWVSTNEWDIALRACRLVWSSAKARKAVPETVQAKLKSYIDQRLEGHTKDYLVASMRERALRPAKLAPHVAWIRNKFPDVPVSWIKKSTLFGSENPFQGVYQVVDGPLAWIYNTDLKQGQAHLYLRIDAQEVNEQTRDAVRQAEGEAHRILAERGVKRQLGYVHSFWPEKKRILREKHGIHWRSPGELNSGIFD